MVFPPSLEHIVKRNTFCPDQCYQSQIKNVHSGGDPQVSSVQFSSVAQWCPTLCDPMNCSTAGLPAAAAAAKSLQSCLTLCNPIDGSPPGSAVPRILQAGKLEWITISFSNV